MRAKSIAAVAEVERIVKMIGRVRWQDEFVSDTLHGELRRECARLENSPQTNEFVGQVFNLPGKCK